MEWLAENWFWVVVGIGFIAMHLFGHGGHGGHGGSGRQGAGDDERSGRPGAHQH